MQGYEIALASMRAINTTCEKCEGRGKVLRTRACAEDDRPDPTDPNDWETCPACHGTGGVAKPKNIENLAEILHPTEKGGIRLGDLQFR